MNAPAKILILRFSAIGDIVLTSPVIRCIKNQMPDTEIHYCTKIQYKKIIENNPYISKVHYLEKDKLKELLAELKKENFDVIIDLHHNLRTLIVKSYLGVKSYSFNKLNFEKWLYVNFKINRMPNIHIVDRFMQTVAPLGIKNDNMGLDFFIADTDEFPLEDLPEPFRNRKYVVLAIGGQHGTKRMPLTKMIELCDRINKPILILGGKEDYETGEKLMQFFEKTNSSKPYEEGLKELGKKTMMLNLCGKCNIGQSASLVKKASYVFAHDTGLMHIAAAFKKEIFSIWGNTTPYFGMYPYQTKFTVFENNKISCRPCSKLGHKECPKGHFKCMNDIVFDFYLP